VHKLLNHTYKHIEPLLSGRYATGVKGGRPSFPVATSVAKYFAEVGSEECFADRYFSSQLGPDMYPERCNWSQIINKQQD